MFGILLSPMILVFFVSIDANSDTKRILLSDSQSFQQELTRIQSELQAQQRKTDTLETELQTLKDKNTKLKNNIYLYGDGNGGAVFTRWGRSDCPENVTQLVYTGFAGGSNYQHPGGAAEYVIKVKVVTQSVKSQFSVLDLDVGVANII